MARLFLTGGSGFIGAEIVKAALSAGHDVAIFDLVEPHVADHVPFWIGGDVRDRAGLARAIEDFAPDHIIHLASDIDVSITELSQFTTTIDGTRNVIELARLVPGLRKLVHISTQFVVTPGVEPPNERYLEPYTVYGEAKAETERMMFSADLPVPWLILRPTIIWGPHHPSFRENIFRHISSRRYLHPIGREPIMRAFGYVTNTAEQILTLTLSSEGGGDRHVFYNGDGTMDYQVWADAFSIGLTGKPSRRVPKWLLAIMGRVGDVVKRLGFPSPIDSGRAFRMSTSSAIDLSTTFTITGAPRVSFEQGVRETIGWLRAHDELTGPFAITTALQSALSSALPLRR